MDNTDNNAVLEYIDKFSSMFNSMVKEALSRKLDDSDFQPQTLFNADKFAELLSQDVKVDTAKLMSQQMAFMEKQAELWQNATRAMLGEKVEPIVEGDKKDKRFADGEWEENPVFNYLKQAYLLNSEMLESMISTMHFTDQKVEEQVKFYTRQYINSVSPTNSILTNPEVCREILDTKGRNLVKGLNNFLGDLEKSTPDAFRITQTPEDAFELGVDLATTEGQVVYQNDLIQLIHYQPTTDTVFQTPVLITPPFINKYYVLDLDQRKSLLRWLVSQGYSTFVISWVNPDESLAHKTLDSYVEEGPLAAMNVVKKITQSKKVNMVGWCIGGTVLSMATAYLRSIDDDSVNSMTLLTTLLDFEQPGEIGNYLNDHMVRYVEQSSDTKGVFDGRIMGLSFSLLRENNLFWSYFINNYLKGKDPAAFDLLYWNSDATNLPSATFKQYLRNTYLDNKLKEPNQVFFKGTPIDLSKIDVPTYLLATMADHIVLWQSAFQSTKLISGPLRFVLAGSGHLAGVVNPVEGGKYPHWVNDTISDDPEHWLETADKREGSWWPDWHLWLQPMSGEQVKPKQPGKSKTYPAIEPAPGSYVKKRLD